MANVKRDVLLCSFNEITSKLHSDSVAAGVHSDSSKDKRKSELFVLFNVYMEEIASPAASNEQIESFVIKINKVLDDFSELVKNKFLKKQINDAYKKRMRSNVEKKVTLKSTTIIRLNQIFETKKICGTFDGRINQLLTVFGVSELHSENDTPTEQLSLGGSEHFIISGPRRITVEVRKINKK
jgi:hypothetical protein